MHLSLGFERRRKSTGVGKNGIGLCQLPVGVGGALRVRSGWDCRDKEVGGKGQKRGNERWKTRFFNTRLGG